MKRSSAGGFALSPQLPHITKTLPHAIARRKAKKQPMEADQFPVVPRPSEEMLLRLNRIGSEHPFCIIYKAKVYDPL